MGETVTLFKGNHLDPQWDKTTRVHDWRNYISDELRAIWDTLTDEQKRIIAENADGIADSEDWD